VLTASEAEAILAVSNLNELHGLRDRAILETLYSTGIRRMELINLQFYDLDAERCLLKVYKGKGKKDRMLPIGKRAIAWIEKYLTEVRLSLIIDSHNLTLFLTDHGDKFDSNYLSIMVRQYIEAANVGKTGSCHLFRHSMATLMLEGGADIRFIQAMLGHANIKTTEIYTQVKKSTKRRIQ